MERAGIRCGRGRALLLGLLAIQAVLGLTGIGLWARSTLADDPLPADRPMLSPDVPRPVALETAYPLAAARAGQWNEDARLVMVSAQVDWPLEVPPGPVRELAGGGWLTFVFVQDEDGDAESLSLLIERYSGAIVQESVVEWGGPAPEGVLDLDTLPVGSVAALVAAENAGGTEFRRECPSARHQTRVSLGLTPGELDATTSEASNSEPSAAAPIEESSGPSWLLGYRDVRDGGSALVSVAVDATTGLVSVTHRFDPEAVGCPA